MDQSLFMYLHLLRMDIPQVAIRFLTVSPGFFINDVIQCLDGTTVDVESDLSAIHSQFGETWAVENSDWIFKNDQFVQGIEQDIQDGASYEASYEITFESNELKIQAEEVSC